MARGRSHHTRRNPPKKLKSACRQIAQMQDFWLRLPVHVQDEFIRLRFQTDDHEDAAIIARVHLIWHFFHDRDYQGSFKDYEEYRAERDRQKAIESIAGKMEEVAKKAENRRLVRTNGPAPPRNNDTVYEQVTGHPDFESEVPEEMREFLLLRSTRPWYKKQATSLLRVTWRHLHVGDLGDGDGSESPCNDDDDDDD